MKPPKAEAAAEACGGFSWLMALGSLFLTFNSGMAVYRSNSDMGSLAFVVGSYLDLVVLFLCLRGWWWYKSPDDELVSPDRENVKMAVWLLTTMLTIAFSYKVAEIMPLVVRMLVRAMASAIVCGGFYAFLVQRMEKVDIRPMKKDQHGDGSTAELATLIASTGATDPGTVGSGSASSSGRRLVADSAATMHAVGDSNLLVDVQPSTTYETVRLPAMNTELPVVGVGRIEWEHFSIPKVYVVVGLQKSVVSISQLDKDHGLRSVFGHGRCQITMADGTVVGEAEVDERDHMYVLTHLQVPEPAQV